MKNAEGRMWKAEKRTFCRVQQTLMLRIPPSRFPLRPSPFALPNSPFALPPSQSPLGLTLIELLVVIAILTTLVAGVVPVLSPNNDTRKIREAARGLQSYIMLAQANAQRTGRPAGISFTESAAGTGVALDIQPIETPPAFAGFSEYSRARLQLSTITYGPVDASTNPNGNDGTFFAPQYTGYPIYGIIFELATSTAAVPQLDLLPSKFVRIGDKINIGGNILLVVDDGKPYEQPNQIDTNFAFERQYILPDPTTSALACIWLNHSGQLPPPSTAFNSYKIHRQPIGQNTKPFASAGASFQLPRGVAIDLQASGVEGEIPGAVHVGMPNYASNPEATVLNSFDSVTGGGATDIQQDTVGIMFSPNGSVSQVFFNGNEVQNVARLFLCLGRVENGAPADYDFNGLSNQQVEEKRKEINWLALDSRWLTISTQSGNTTVTENAFVNPLIANDFDGDGNDISIDPEDQISAARDFAREQKRGGGN